MTDGPIDGVLETLLGTEEGGPYDGPTLHECRHCGTKFDDAPGECHNCGATEIATYELDALTETDDD